MENKKKEEKCKKCNKVGNKCNYFWYNNTVLNKKEIKNIENSFENGPAKEFITHFYKILGEDIEKLYDKHIDKIKELGKGKKRICDIFESALKGALKKLEQVKNVEKKSILDKNFEECFNVKKPDLIINDKIIIEIKTVLEFNSLGAAILEGAVRDKAKYPQFYIATLHIHSADINKGKENEISSLTGLKNLLQKEKIKCFANIKEFANIKDILVFGFDPMKSEKDKEVFIESINNFIKQITAL